MEAKIVIPSGIDNELHLIQNKVDDLKARGFKGKLIIDPYLFYHYNISLVPTVVIVHNEGHYVTANIAKCKQWVSMFCASEFICEKAVNN